MRMLSTRTLWILSLLYMAGLLTGSPAPVTAAQDANVVVVMDDTSPLLCCLQESGVSFSGAPTPLAGLTNGTTGLLIVDASPQNLEVLSGAKREVEAFTSAGGWIILCGLFPDGLDYFNKIVGVDHLIRSFEMEDVLFAEPRDPVLEGLRTTDIFFESREWSDAPDAIPMRSSGLFTYVVDYDDIAAFSALPGLDYWGISEGAPGAEEWPRNMLNGLTYHPKFGFSIALNEQRPTKWTVTFPRVESVIGFSWVPDNVYNRVEEVWLDPCDGGAPVIVKLDSSSAPVQIAFAPRKTREVTIEIRKWKKSGTEDVVAVRDIGIKVKRSAQFYRKVRPLLSVGGLVKYPMGRGGVLLNQLHILEKEPSAVNGEKKRRIAHTILKNM